MRARTAWALLIPLLLLSETLGHALVARLFDPHGARHTLFARTADDYLQYAYAALAICVVLAATALVRRALASFRARAPRPLPSWRLSVIAPAIFLVHEHLERSFQDGQGWLTTAEPAVIVGVLLQIPCGIAALWVVRALLRAADQVGCALATRNAGERRRPSLPELRRDHQSPLLRRLALACGRAERAPPAFA